MAAKVKVTRSDKEWQQIRNNLRAIGSTSIRAGFLGESAMKPKSGAEHIRKRAAKISKPRPPLRMRLNWKKIARAASKAARKVGRAGARFAKRTLKHGLIRALKPRRKKHTVRFKYRKAVSKSGVPNIATVAKYLEFGTKRIPARPVIRPAMADGRKELVELAGRVMRFACNPKNNEKGIEQRANLLGMKMQAMIQAKITSITEPPLAASTIKTKGSSKPWIDTGQLRSSVTYEVVQRVEF